jgi:hypothetical protein
MNILYVKPEGWKERLDLQSKYEFSEAVIFIPLFDSLSVWYSCEQLPSVE